ncbi:MAG: prolipoprotein diacylglyceryl transferase, partial [Clostridiaceae bacterium]|nr:prolipoprotein diacylglyceryl transferase [Clostridiaceae bacterium]
IIGSRLYYVIFSWDEFKDNLIQILDTRKGGLAIYGGIIAGLIAAFIFAKVKKLNFLHLFDFGITYVPMAQAIGRWGNFINQEAYGTNTSLPWGMTSDTIRNELAASASKLSQMGIYVDPAKPVHPTFLYESLWDLGVFLFLLWYRKRKKVNGEVFFLYMVLYGIGRACIESLRTDSLMLGNHRISQAIAIVFAIAFTILIFVMRKYRYSKEESEVYELGSSSYGAI